MAKKTAYWGLALVLCLFMSFFAGRAVLAAEETEEESLTVVPTKGTEEETTETEEPTTRETMPPPPVTYYLPSEVAGMTKPLTEYYDAVANNTLMVDVEADLDYITDEELQLKTKAINRYQNLGVTNLSYTGFLNIRTEPNTDAEVVGKLTNNCGVEILETLNGWYKIESGGIYGYVSAEYVMEGENARARGLAMAQVRAIVLSDVLNVRSEPNENSEVWTQVSNRERYVVTGWSGNWVELSIDGSTGYASADYLEVRYALNEAVEYHEVQESAEEGVSSIRVQIANYAVQFLGNPYVWGGTSLTNGCDCSGFVQSVLAHFGYYIERTSRDQAYCGRQISSGDLRPGDLLFYAKNGSINHVAMYIGNGQVIHASDKRSGIKISTWNYRTPVRIISVID